MGNQQSNAGAAKFFGGVTDLITAPVNQATTLLVGKPIIPSASAAIAASSDPNVNSNAGAQQATLAVMEVKKGVTGTPGTLGGMFANMPRDNSKPPSNMMCMKAVGQDTPTLNAESQVWYCGTGNDADRTNKRLFGQLKGNKPTPHPTEEWTGGGALTNNPPGTDYTPNRGPQPHWEARPGDGVSPPIKRPRIPNSKAPQSDDPQQLNPQFNVTGANDASNKVVLGGDSNSLSVAQGFPNLNASDPARDKAPPAAPAMNTTTLVMIGGAVVVGAVLLAKKK